VAVGVVAQVRHVVAPQVADQRRALRETVLVDVDLVAFAIAVVGTSPAVSPAPQILAEQAGVKT
jgi:hypothetical protein